MSDMKSLCYPEDHPRKTYVQGPIHAMLAANNEPKSCPSVAPAPIKPNNLEPDSLSMTSITLAQVDDIVRRLSKATQRKKLILTAM